MHMPNNKAGQLNSGDATGGAANAEGIRGFNCYACPININPQATGGQAASGAATGGAGYS